MNAIIPGIQVVGDTCSCSFPLGCRPIFELKELRVDLLRWQQWKEWCVQSQEEEKVYERIHRQLKRDPRKRS